MARKRRRITHPDVETVDAAGVAVLGLSRHARGKRRRRRAFFVLLLLLVALVAAAPMIVATTALKNQLLSRVIPADAGKVTCERAHFSWWGGQALIGLKWTDPYGNPLVEVDHASIDRSLIALMGNRSSLGTVKVTRPTVYVETREGGSNWEEALAALATPQAEGEAVQGADSHSDIVVEVEIVDGAVAARDATSGQQWRMDQLQVSAASAASGSGWAASGSAQANAADGATGTMRFRLEPQDDGRQNLELFTEALPLSPLEPWLARTLPGCRIVGVASADMHVAWTPQPDGAPLVNVDGKLGLANLSLSADALSGDVLQMAVTDVSARLAIQGDALTVDRFTAAGDWFNADATGAVNVTELAKANLQGLPKSDASVTARFDLVQLAKQLPHALNLRNGVRIDAGSVDLTAESVNAGEGRRWDVTAAIKNLHGADGRREIQWSKPVFAVGRMVDSPTGPRFDYVRFDAPFATVKVTAGAAGDAANGFDGTFRFDLEQLSQELSQFVDLTDWQLTGSGSGEFTLRETSATGILATTQADLREIDVRHQDRAVWVDRQLFVDMQGVGQRAGWSLDALSSATLKLQGVDDHLTVELLEPVDFVQAQSAYAVRVRGKGPLESWAGRMRPWVDGVPEELSGEATVDAQLTTGAGVIYFTESLIDVVNLRARAGDVLVDEPRALLQGDYRWQADASALTSTRLQLTTSTAALVSRDLALQLPAVGPATARGEIAFRVNLERVAGWAGLLAGPEPAWPRGEAVGSLKLHSDDQRAVAELSLTGDNVKWLQADAASIARKGPTELWSEPHVTASGNLIFTHADDRLQIQNLQVSGETVQLAGTAVMDGFHSAQTVRGEVNLTYAAAELAKLLTEYLGPGVELQGANMARVAFAGHFGAIAGQLGDGVSNARANEAPTSLTSTGSPPPVHWSQRWQVTTDAGWSSGSLYGLPLGAANLTALLQNGQLAFQPIDVAVGQGRITAQPRALLDPAPSFLELPQGPLITHVAVSPEVSEASLKYAAPVLTGATRSQGEFSIELDGARIPLEHPERADVGGRLIVHQLQVLPGPSTEPLVTTIRQLAALSRGKDVLGGAPVRQGNGVTINQQTIDVRILDGRVHHRNLEFLIDDVPVRSTGWVGFDETMQFTIEVPVQEKWVRGSSAFRSLAGQIIQIPVRGTLTRWRVDDKVIGQLLQQGAQQVIGNEINRALDRLLRPK